MLFLTILLLNIQHNQFVSKLSFYDRGRVSFFTNTKGPGTSFQVTFFAIFLINYFLL